MISLNDQQLELVDKVMTWYNNLYHGSHINYSETRDLMFVYSGPAGSGKTTVVKYIIEKLGLKPKQYIAAAYVGKAVTQLQKNGLSAKTIHSLIYKAIPVTKVRPDGTTYNSFEFILRDQLEEDYKLIIIDEAGMVNDRMVEEILSYEIPTIFMGDMNQLPPVFGNCTVMENPDYILTKIMRQNEDNPIIKLSQMVLNDIPLFEGDYGSSKVVNNFSLYSGVINDFDQIICNTNKLRNYINDSIRYDFLGYNDRKPRLFEKVICRQNNWYEVVDGFALTNGTTGIITDIDKSTLSHGYYSIDFHPDYFQDNMEFTKLRMDAEYIKLSYEVQKNVGKIYNEKFEYAYAITTHLSQGETYKKVLYFDSFFHDKNMTKRARYTAITRASDSVIIVKNYKF